MKPPLPACLLSLAITACSTAAQPITGYYRYGHEVNTICTGDPGPCYWLVDTAPEVRSQLRQQVAGMAQYAPVCLKLDAEISSQKADGFGLDYDGSIRVLELLGRCDDGTQTRLADLQHHRWILYGIDGQDLADYAREQGFDGDLSAVKLPELDFGDQGFVAGNTGCNQIQGQARVEDNQLILSQLATTAMLCAGFAAELELRLQLLYRNPLDIERDANDLVLRANRHELRYGLRDWVQ